MMSFKSYSIGGISFFISFKPVLGASIFLSHDVENNKNETLIQSKKIYSDGLITFDYLEPKTYIIKIYEDWNDDGKWDTGNYKLNLQPETVHYFRKEIKVRSNWEVEENVVITHEH